MLLAVAPNLPGLVASVNSSVRVGAISRVFDFAWLFGVRPYTRVQCLALTTVIKFCSSSIIYALLSLAFPAKETFVGDRSTTEDTSVLSGEKVSV